MTKKTSSTWDDLYRLENQAALKLRKALSPFHESVKHCYECGVELTALEARRQGSVDVALPQLYLKRSLTDLRAIWRLLLLGYTSQAATLAASAFEHALIAACVSGSKEMSEQLDHADILQSPWGVANLCKRIARQTQEERISMGEEISDVKYEMWWRATYGYYKWLCKIKHPTLTSVAYDASSAQKQSFNQLQSPVEVIPNINEEDLPNKCVVIFVAYYINEAIHRLGLASEINLANENDRFLP